MAKFILFWQDELNAEFWVFSMLKQVQVLVLLGLSALAVSVSAKDKSSCEADENKSTQATKVTHVEVRGEKALTAHGSCRKKNARRTRTSMRRGRSSLIRTYTAEDLQRTGHTDTLQALRHLDPSVF